MASVGSCAVGCSADSISGVTRLVSNSCWLLILLMPRRSASTARCSCSFLAWIASVGPGVVGASANSAGAATWLASDNGWLRVPPLLRSAACCSFSSSIWMASVGSCAVGCSADFISAVTGLASDNCWLGVLLMSRRSASAAGCSCSSLARMASVGPGVVGASANSAGAATCLASDNGWLGVPPLVRGLRHVARFRR